jgi:signal transduction histidine kinase
MPGERSTIARYLVAIGVVAIAMAFELLPSQIGAAWPFLLLSGAVVVAAWYGGRGPAVLAVALSTMAAAYYLFPPFKSLALGSDATVDLGVFIAEACLTAGLTVAATESSARARANARACQCSERQLRRLNKAHRALSISSETLVRARDEAVLLEEICRAIVEVAGYRMCWVGLAERDEHRTVRPIARAGHDDGYVEHACVTWADTDRGRGPVGTAIRTGRPFVEQEVADDAFTPWRAEALARGYASVIALPLVADGWAFGALTIYASERHAFDADAVRLLTDLGNDIAFGLSALRARAAVAAERARFETTVMQAPVAVAVCAGPDHVVRLANQRWLALRNGLESVGRPLRESLPAAAAAGSLAPIDQAYATGEPREMTEQPIPRERSDGSLETRYYTWAVQPLRGAAELVTDVILTVCDVTEQVHARLALEQARVAAEQANRAKDQLLCLVSHELRTPLTSILGCAEMLRRNPTPDPRRLLHGLDVILRNARTEAQIVEDLMDVSTIVAGGMHLEVQPVALGPIVQACVDDARPAAEAKGVRIEASIANDTALSGDPARLAQVAKNLLSNAIKFTPRGGLVSVEVERQDDALTLEVRDTGVGIPTGELPHVFECFRVGDGSMTRAHGGLGLGLYIVRHVVEAHGGAVRVESAGPGLGATFVVDLPLHARTEAGAARSPPAPSHPAPPATPPGAPPPPAARAARS